MSASDALRRSWADPAVRARRIAGLRASVQCNAAARAASLRARRIVVPAWVENGLRQEYREMSAMFGDAYAASHCRGLMCNPQRAPA